MSENQRPSLPDGHLRGLRSRRDRAARPGRLRPPTPATPEVHAPTPKQPETQPQAASTPNRDPVRAASAPGQEKTERLLCWSCGRRPAVPGFAAHIKLEKTVGYRPTLFPLGVARDYLKLTVRVPLCRRCSSVWRVREAFVGVVGCSGCLVILCFILAAIAAGLWFLLLAAPAVLVLGAAIAVSLKVYERSLCPDGQLRHPTTHPDVLAARRRHRYR